MGFDICIYNGRIVTVDPDFRIIDNGTICIGDGKILSVGKTEENGRLPESRELINAKGGIVMPGLVNTHSHLPMTLFRGLADDLPLHEWLNEHIFPAESRFITPETVRLGTMLGCLEMIMSGTTTCCDGYFYEDIVADAVRSAGMRGVLGQGVIDFPAPGVPDPAKNVICATEFVEKWSTVSPLVTPSIFCHSPYTCSAETLLKSKEAASSKGVLFQIHVAETEEEKSRIQSEHGVSPIQYLDKLGILDRDTLLVHTIWVDDDDIGIIARRNAKVSVTTESEMKLASGIAPLLKFLGSGIDVGLGTDSAASNNDLDLFEEMDFTAKLHKVNHMRSNVMDAKTVLELATIGGAKAIGLGHAIGSLEKGKQADIVVLNTRKPHLVPLYNPVSHIVYSASGADVCHVVIAGKTVVKNRNPVWLDPEKIMDDVILASEPIKKEDPNASIFR